MTTVDSLPSNPLRRETVLALNESKTDVAVLPVSYYGETYVYSMTIMTDEYDTVVGFDGDQWVELTRITTEDDEEFDPEGVIDEWMRDTHPDLYHDPAFEVTSEDYGPE